MRRRRVGSAKSLSKLMVDVIATSLDDTSTYHDSSICYRLSDSCSRHSSLVTCHFFLCRAVIFFLQSPSAKVIRTKFATRSRMQSSTLASARINTAALPVRLTRRRSEEHTSELQSHSF